MIIKCIIMRMLYGAKAQKAAKRANKTLKFYSVFWHGICLIA